MSWTFTQNLILIHSIAVLSFHFVSMSVIYCDLNWIHYKIALHSNFSNVIIVLDLLWRLSVWWWTTGSFFLFVCLFVTYMVLLLALKPKMISLTRLHLCCASPDLTDAPSFISCSSTWTAMIQPLANESIFFWSIMFNTSLLYL